jgi:DNA repair exonuclease SbcCD ATPase subunit
VAELDDAAEELSLKLKELEHEAQEGAETIQSLGEKLDAVTSRLDEEWKELGERVSAFLEKVQEQGGRMGDEVQEAGEALAALQNGIASAQNETGEAVSGARGELSGLEEHVRAQHDPLETMVSEQVEHPLEAIARQADDLRQALDHLAMDAQQFFERDVSDAVAAMGERIRERVQEVREGPIQECLDGLDEAYGKWLEGLEFIEETVLEKAYLAAPPHAQQVVEFVLREVRGDYDPAIGEAGELAELIEQGLVELKQEAAAQAAALEKSQTALSNGHDELTRALADAVGALDAVKQLLASFTFVQV